MEEPDALAEASFWLDEAGNLVRYVEGPPVVSAAADIGESDYTIESIDTAVDDSLFEISAYQPAG